MRRKRLCANGGNEGPILDISSLVDVSFLLLVFFLAAMTLQKAEADLEMSLPDGEGVRVPMLEVTIDTDGVISANEEVLEADAGVRKLPRLLGRLEEYKRLARLSQGEPLVVVMASDDAQGQRFVDVLNCLAKAEIEQVTLSGFRD